MVEEARKHGIPVRGYVSTVMGCPYEGDIAPEQVATVAKALYDMGCHEISLGDTIGVGTPLKAKRMLEAVAAHVPMEKLAAHFHDTYGQALSNVQAGLRAGVTTYDASAGGLGGCPYAQSATGNLATEDLVWLLDGLGIDHGVDLEALVATSAWMAQQLGRPSPSAVVRALAAGLGAGPGGASSGGPLAQSTS